MPDIEKKLRIQLFDKDMNMLSDRLVTQATEFMKGPSEPHEGPLKMELCLFTKEDIDEAKRYLDILQGIIPIETEKKKRGRKKSKLGKVGYRESLVETLKELKTMPEVIETLRGDDFIFTSLELLEDMEYPILVSKVHRNGYKYMVRLTRRAKNPINDKYDPTLLVGFKDEKMVVYDGEDLVHKATFEESAEKMVKVPPKAKVRFPQYLTQDERNQFRAEMQLLKDKADKQPSRFYKRWVWEVVKSSPEGIVFPRVDTIPQPE